MPTSPRRPNAVVRVVERLELEGLNRYEYRLYDAIDPDILENILKSGSPEILITFPVRDYQVTFFGDGAVNVEGRD